MHGPRAAFVTLAPEAYKGLTDIGASLETSTLGKPLIDLVFLRISQINGCAFCVDMHARDLLTLGEDPQRLNSLVAWHETTFFSDRERAALQWAEALTLVAATHAPDSDFALLKEHFNEKQIVDLTYAIALINAWNRLAIGMRQPVKRATLPMRVAAAAT
jgi:uncharacterized peroxidase-related enzyme